MKFCLKCGSSALNSEWLCSSCGKKPETINGFLAFAPDLAEVNDGFRPERFLKLSELEKNNFWFYSRNILITWALNHYFPNAKNFLEIGCGTGFVLSGIGNSIPHIDLSGSEIFTGGLSIVRQRLKKANLYQMDARNIPFKDEFDLIGAFDVLEHIKEDELVINQICKATNNSGGIIITVPQHPWLWSDVDERACHKRRYTAKEIRYKVEQAGFKVVRMTSFISLLLPLMIISRLREKRYNSLEDVNCELKVNRFLNYFFKMALSIERCLIKLGVSLPFGGSLLLIAKK